MNVNIRPHPTHEGWYQVEYRPDGIDGKRKRIVAESYESAESIRASILEHHLKPAEVLAKLRPRIKDVYKEYLQWVENNQAKKTHADKVLAFNIIIPHFGELQPQQLTQRIFDDFQTKLKGKRAAIIKYQHYLMAMINWMIKRKLADQLNFKAEKPKYHASKPVIPNMVDVQRVIDQEADPARKMLLITMLWTGLRWNEARLLRWEDVYPVQGVIRVRESIEEAEVHVAIYPAMQKWFTVNKRPAGWVFPNPATGEPWTSFKRSLATASKKVGASIDHHDFRRRSGQNAYEASGHDVFAAQRHLRHKDIRTTMRYLGIDDQRRNDINRSMVEHVDRLLSKQKLSTVDKRTKAAKPANKPIRKPHKTDS